MDLYRRPEYYDVAFSWELITLEMERLEQCFSNYASGEVRRLLEPACGTGRFLVRWPDLGYRVTGYDRGLAMLRYAAGRIRAAGAGDAATLAQADMRTAAFGREFDAAYNAVNSVGYLLTEEDIRAHFAATARSVRPGGVYVLQIACAGEGEERYPPDEWTCERDGVRVTTRWSVEEEDRERRLSRELCRMEIDDHGRVEVFEDPHVLHLWLVEDLRRLARESGFDWVTAVDFHGNEFPATTRITGAHGNLYHVLRRL